MILIWSYLHWLQRAKTLNLEALCDRMRGPCIAGTTSIMKLNDRTFRNVSKDYFYNWNSKTRPLIECGDGIYNQGRWQNSSKFQQELHLELKLHNRISDRMWRLQRGPCIAEAATILEAATTELRNRRARTSTISSPSNTAQYIRTVRSSVPNVIFLQAPEFNNNK